MKLINGYYYLFYKLYKFSEAAPSKWLSDWKAIIAIDALLLFFLSSIISYYRVFINSNSHIGEGNLFLVFVIIVNTINYFIFQHNNRWKEIINKFDKLPKSLNKKGGIFVFLIILVIIINFISSFYLFYNG